MPFSKMKPFLPMSEKVKADIEGIYPNLLTLRSNVLAALTNFDENEKKQVIFQGLRRCESLMSSEVSKLISKPKRATKFSVYMKRVITMLKMALDCLSDENQAEAYPTLSLISAHFTNIILPSSLVAREPPAFIAVNLYCFFKSVFSVDLEYVLDILICSNVFDEAESSKSVGYYMLVEAMMDNYLYTRETPSFAKYLTILAFLSERTDGQDEKLGSILTQLDAQTAQLPNDIQPFMEKKYGIKFHKGKKNKGGRLSWKNLIGKIKTRKVAHVTRRERLVVVSGKQKQPKGTNHNQENGNESQDSSVKGSIRKKYSSPPLFYFDAAGSGSIDNADNIDDEPDLEILNQNLMELMNNENLANTSSEIDAFQLLPKWSDNDDESLTPFSPRSTPTSFDEVNSSGSSISAQKPTESKASPRKSRKLSSSSEDSDSLQVVFEDINKKKKVDKEMLSESEEERDFAEPESGEDENEVEPIEQADDEENELSEHSDIEEEENEDDAFSLSGSPSKIKQKTITNINIESEEDEEEPIAKTPSPSSKVDDKKTSRSRTRKSETVESDIGAPISKRTRQTSESNSPIKGLRKSKSPVKSPVKNASPRKSKNVSPAKKSKTPEINSSPSPPRRRLRTRSGSSTASIEGSPKIGKEGANKKLELSPVREEKISPARNIRGRKSTRASTSTSTALPQKRGSMGKKETLEISAATEKAVVIESSVVVPKRGRPRKSDVVVQVPTVSTRSQRATRACRGAK